MSDKKLLRSCLAMAGGGGAWGTQDMRSISDRLRQKKSRTELKPLIAVLLLVVATLTGFWNLRTWSTSRDRAAQQVDVLSTAERLLSALKDLETGQRGYLLVGSDEFLEPYRTATASLNERLEELRLSLERSGAPLAAFEAMRDVVEKKRAFAEQTVSIRRQAGFEPALDSIRGGLGKTLMDDARAQTGRLQAVAQRQLASIDRSAMRRSLLLSLASFALALAAVGYFARLAVLRRREGERTTALLDGVLENAPVGLGFLDGGLRIRHMNVALAEMSDRTLGADIGEEIWSVLPTLRETLEPKLRSVLTAGHSVSNVEVEVGMRSDARRLRQLVMSFYPLRDTQAPGQRGIGLVVVDATTRKRAERRLQDSERRFRTLINATAAMFWTTDKDGRFVRPQSDWSEFTGQTYDELKGEGWLDAVHPDDRDVTTATWLRAVETSEIYKIEHRVRNRSGEWRHMLVRAVPIFDDGDESVREWAGSSTDITERKSMEIELATARDAAEQANRAKSQFIANMSHELRTPLSAVIGYSEMLQEELEDRNETELLEDMRKIESNARHLLGLINDVLDLSKIEAEKMEVYPETFQVGEMVRDVAATVEALVTKKENDFEVQIDDAAVGEMHTDQTKLRQCLINLLSNASKFTENGRITLSAEPSRRDGDAWVTFKVVDTGIGMTEEQVAKLFERFTQADASTTRKFGGTGLGLAITRAFSTMLGGDIEVQSAYGSGTTFSLHLPAKLSSSLVRDMPESSAQGRPAESSERPENCVLIIDDDPATRDLLARFLRKEGFSVRAAADGEAGLELARTLRPRVILLDVTMPRMDGWTVLRALKADPDLVSVPVVMVTIIDEQNLAFTLGASDYLAKPIEWDRLKGVMDQFRREERAGTAMIVDDDPEARERLDSLLQKEGWKTTQAENGKLALDRMASEPPDLILLDLMMPEMDGFAFLREMRTHAQWRNIPVVVLTAKDITAADRKRLAPRADRVIQKGSMSMRDLARELSAFLPDEKAAKS
ncbi:MAG: domain S-box protein [Hyphomicrobiales bacterium]|nr:domain S-box protein [Hyphomicrobiales bacterium]